jgi:hypothetical protein
MRHSLQLQSNCSRILIFGIEAYRIEIARSTIVAAKDYLALAIPCASNLPYYMQAQKRHFFV